jgi:hypothetical protein
MKTLRKRYYGACVGGRHPDLRLSTGRRTSTAFRLGCPAPHLADPESPHKRPSPHLPSLINPPRDHHSFGAGVNIRRRWYGYEKKEEERLAETSLSTLGNHKNEATLKAANQKRVGRRGTVPQIFRKGIDCMTAPKFNQVLLRGATCRN